MRVKDLADYLGVSTATISLVLNNKPGISEKTRQRVFEAVESLGCTELMPVKAEAEKTLIFVVYRKHGSENTSGQYFSKLFSEVIEGVERQAREKGCKLMISYIDKDSIKHEAERIHGMDADGVLLLATEMNAGQVAEFEAMEIPVVILDNYIEDKNYDCVTINNELGVYQAVKHLQQAGHSRLGYLHVCHNANNFQERYFGFRRALTLLDLPFQEEYLVRIDTLGGDTLAEFVRKSLGKMPEMPTAFFADNDIAAIAAMKSLRELGYRIPEDISVVGFDNMPLSEMMDPPLTTIGTSKQRMGVEAVNRVVQKIQDKYSSNLRTEVATKLVARQSVRQLEKEN